MTTLGVIVGNRGFFPDHLCETGRKTALETLEKAGVQPVVLSTTETKFGAVETMEDARKCAALFEARRKEIQGVLVTLPNFGDERAVANAIRWSGLNVPVLVHAFNDDPQRMTVKERRDSFCGKMSVCNNLRQYGIRFTLTRQHTVDPDHPSFQRDLEDFLVTCRVMRALRGMRVGALGARPTAFNTVRFSEKLLERSGVTVETMDLYDMFGRVEALADDDPEVLKKLQAIESYVPAGGTPKEARLKMAKFGAALDRWIREASLDATAVQCWTAMEEFFGVVPCAVMSMLSNSLLSSACEVDVTGAVAMQALAAGSRRPSALVDWNNNYGKDPDKCVLFHCSNLPRDLFEAEPKMSYQEIIAGSVGKENTYGTIVGRLKISPLTFLRISTDEFAGRIRAYVGEGELTPDPLDTFGGFGVCRIPNLQKLLAYICRNGFEHHVAINPGRVADGVFEALSNYMGWDVYRHE